MGFSRQEYWSGLPFPSPVDHILSELYTMTCLSWMALHGMAHSFIELGPKLWSMWSDWLVFCDCGFQSVCPHLPVASPLRLDMGYLLTVSSTMQPLLQHLPSCWGFSALGCGALANSKFPITRRIPQRELDATPRTLQLVLWDPVGSECFSWGLWDFNLAGGIYPEATCLIQDGSRPSLSRDQEIYLLSVLEYNLCQAVLAL